MNNGGFEIGIDDAHFVEVGFDNQLVEVEAETHGMTANDVHLVDSLELAIDEIGIPGIDRANFVRRISAGANHHDDEWKQGE